MLSTDVFAKPQHSRLVIFTQRLGQLWPWLPRSRPSFTDVTMRA